MSLNRAVEIQRPAARSIPCPAYKRLRAWLLVLSLAVVTPLAGAQKEASGPQQEADKKSDAGQPTAKPYSTVFYPSGNLRIEAYLYKPEGEGPFPVVIYNHGSRAGRERLEVPFLFVATMLSASGYAVLVPERRGYGKSDGTTFAEEVGNDVGQKLIHRFYEESSDVLASLEYLKSVSFVDSKRIAIMGWSHGGIATVLTASQSDAFRAVINQAGGALTWNRSSDLRRTLTDAARKIKAPVLCLDAENDANPDSVRKVCDSARSAGAATKTIIYPPFTPSNPPPNIAPGHLIFTAEGMPIWRGDVQAFLEPVLENRQGH